MEFHWLVLLRMVHVGAAAIWFGVVVFGTFFLGPAVQAAGEPGRSFMAALARRGGFARFMGPVAMVALASGALLYWRMGYLRAPFASTASTLLTLGALLATGGWLFALASTAPLQREAKALAARAESGAAGPGDAARAQAIQGTIARRTRVVAPVVGIAFLLMVGRTLVT